ncbi:MAG: hypothetical protein ACI4AQ_06145 [Lachnospiraceae bacterium]
MKKIIRYVRIVFLIMILGALNLSACTSLVNDTNLSASINEINQSPETESSETAETEVWGTESEPIIGASVQGDSFPLVYDGFDTGMEILFEDCVCEYDKNSTKVYSYYVNNFDIQGYVLYVENIEHTSTIFPVKDYLIDQEGENLYMLWGIDSFERIQGIDFAENPYGYKVQSISSMESLISEAYGLEFMDDGTDFEDLQVEFTGIREDKKRFLCGKATAVYKRTGKQYTIEWEIDTDTYTGSVKGF